jgi:Fur family transcriptional regulator, ferric uptake regulator
VSGGAPPWEALEPQLDCGVDAQVQDALMRTRRNNAAAATAGPAIDRFRSFLHERSLRVTDVREAIVRAAMGRDGHFDIDELTRDVQGLGVEASRATVYRALPLLMEAGIIQPTILSGERRRYEAAFGHAHHDHLICSRCGKVVEFQFEAFEVLQKEVAAKYGYELKGHFHELIGVCSSCKKARAES